ncbi:MAG: hypothetical protein AAGU21_02720 [Solidesulfovibrio sp.]|uniref:tetratricopeptide repeat protein n=1 Tax=Solidesulfovibrio sp. TaxID=2910990 RepID=UPI0031585BEC
MMRLPATIMLFAFTLVSASVCLADPAEDFREGQAAIRAGQIDKAIEAYTRVIKASVAAGVVDVKDLASAYNMRGMCHEAKEEAELALADYTKAIEVDVKMAEAYGNRAMLYMKLGEVDKAKADATAARRIDRKVKVPDFQ